MKLKINNKHQKEVVKLRKLIEKHRKLEDKAFDKLASKMGIEIAEEVGAVEPYEILWDYVFNGTEWTVEIEQ